VSQAQGPAPIAIVGQSCVLPGALNPEQLWAHIEAGRDLLTATPSDRWRIDRDLILFPQQREPRDATWSDRGGYVEGFEPVFDPTGFAVGAEALLSLDPLFHFVLHGAREALRDAGHDTERAGPRVGAVIGNLSFPSASLAAWAESVWCSGWPGREGAPPHPLNRFMSGLPAHLLAQALRLGQGAFALDAACASSLYAIKLASDRLHDGRADLMLAGAVNRADDLFIHVGFCALQAMSRSGRSRPFHREADGLVPAEGAAFVVLKRLADAEAAGDRVLGVIRSIGLSNDGRGAGLLAPSAEGQVRAMRSAYQQAGIQPSDVSLIECHATGTPVGDGVELQSTAEVFGGSEGVPIGSLKSGPPDHGRRDGRPAQAAGCPARRDPPGHVARRAAASGYRLVPLSAALHQRALDLPGATASRPQRLRLRGQQRPPDPGGSGCFSRRLQDTAGCRHPEPADRHRRPGRDRGRCPRHRGLHRGVDAG